MTAYSLADRSWVKQAACLDHPTLPPATWDAETAGDRLPARKAARIAEARAVCATCPVAEPCVAEARADFGGGIRGGRVYGDARLLRNRRHDAA